VSGPALVLGQLRLEQKTFWRNREAATFFFALPVVLLVLFGALFNGAEAVGDVPFKHYFASGVIGIAIVSATFTNLAIVLAVQRDQLLLKRFRGTPLSPAALFGAKILSAVIVVCLQVAILVGVARFEFGTALPANPFAFCAAVVAGIVVLSMGGIAMSALIPNGDSAPAIVNLPYLVLMFISGLFFNFAQQPGWLKGVADVFPLRWLLDAIRAGYLGRDFFHTRAAASVAGHASEIAPTVHGFNAVSALAVAYAVLALWLLAFALVAVRRFRWEPRAT
jgi:ABC-2 type transport system permease protein